MMKQREIRTRFAPSPTGHLHIGSARTALFCWLFTRKHQGTFILRIEDTDRERSTEASIAAIFDGMEWLGLDYDEGPYYQTKRFDRYKEVIQELLASGNAYRCYCSKERIEKLREKQLANKEKPRYDGHCRDLNREDNDVPYVVRFRNPKEGIVSFDDIIRGKITVKNSELDDLIIARTDGTPTYNFTVVVDDWDMQITQVIRGDDHINNTPRQINILKALNAELPEYAHVPMILGQDGKRLSKRHGAVSLQQFRDEGFLPETLLNYLVRLGWASGDKEIFSRDEMIELFNLNAVSRSPAAFNQEKLLWLNQYYLKTLDPSMIVKPFSEQLKKLGINFEKGPPLEKVITAQAERAKTLVEMAERSRFFYEEVEAFDEKAASKNLKIETLEPLKAFKDRLSEISDWNKNAIHQIIEEIANEFEIKLGKIAQPIRVAVTGGTVSPPIDVTLWLIGRERVIKRLDKALAYITATADNEIA